MAGRPRSIDRSAIDAVALDLFLERGFAAVTGQDIADACGVSRPTIYRLVARIEDVVIDQVGAAVDGVVGHLAASDARDWAALRAAFGAAFRDAASSPLQAKALLVLQRNRDVRMDVMSRVRHTRRRMAETLREGGHFGGDPELCELAAGFALTVVQIALARDNAGPEMLAEGFRRAAEVFAEAN